MAPTRPYDETEPLPGELMLSLLPVWHITERTFELFMLVRGCHVVYSGIRWFKNDLAKYQPQWMVLVPRVLEKVAFGVQDKFASGSAAVKALVKLFTATSTLKNKHQKIRKGLVVGDEPPTPMDGIISTIIVKALAPLNFLGNKLVWKKVQDGFGGRQRVIISGGSALAGSLETFYENCGIDILVGYGLTECSPLLSYRRTDSNLVTAGCVGFAATDTELRVVDPEANPENGERKALPDGLAGVVLGRGPQVMKGYYKNPEATGKAVDKWGWFDTGDLGRINPATGDLILTGRAKDTIVLSNGENIEPQPIEGKKLKQCILGCLCSTQHHLTDMLMLGL
jgi:long-chain acyl-CoA synthetase